MQHFGRAAGTAIKGMSRAIPQRGLSTITHPPMGSFSKMATYGKVGATGLGFGLGLAKLGANKMAMNEELGRMAEQRKRWNENNAQKAANNAKEAQRIADLEESKAARDLDFFPMTPKERNRRERRMAEQTRSHGHVEFGGSRRKHRGKTHGRKNRKNRKTRRN